MKNILLPTDFSTNARNALKYALQFFGKGNHFILLNTWQAPYTPPEVLISVEDILMKASKEGLGNELKAVKAMKIAENNTFETVSQFGNLVDVISSVAREKKVDFVVMGTQGASGLRETLLGSNAASAAKSINCPLLMVPAKNEFKTLQNIVFAADYRHIEKQDSLAALVALAKTTNAEITILNVLDKGKITDVNQGYEGLKIDHFFNGVKHAYSFIENEDKAAGIDEYLHTNNPDLLVMLERKTGFFRSIFHQSITKQMAFHTHMPMLVLHE
jgi:nucleotide-binding universal stress UspA family protein